MKAIVFAAGMGTRLKPFTLSHPKALVEVGGVPMLERTILRLKHAGIDDIVINVHHFPEQIITFLKSKHDFGCRILISDESRLLLETGGAIVKAAPLLLDEEPFIACNADILTDLPVKDLIKAHADSDADVTLLAQERNASRYLFFNKHTRLLEGWMNPRTGDTLPAGFTPAAHMLKRAFGGFHVISQKALRMLVETASSEAFGIIPFYVNHSNILKIKAYTPEISYQWFDIGSPETLEIARNSFIEK